VSEAWVINASPLILFARIARLDLFERLAPRIIVPSAVFEEVRAGQEKDATAASALAWAAERRVPDAAVPVGVEHWDLGPGESQVIAHGLTGWRWVVLDDLAARRCAASHGVAVIGSLGVVLRSKQRGLLDEARPWVTKLIEAGMFVDGRLVELALDSVGE
jgi:predicted nucleic acid-binding protein